MVQVNDNFLKLPASYLFSEIARKVEQFRKDNPDAPVIRMGIGDVTRPVCQAAIQGLRRGVDDEARESTFHGYGPEQGYDFLRKAIADTDYRARGIEIDDDEIFISDGAKSDTGNIGDIFSRSCKVAVTDPVYPVYVDTNVMAGRAGEHLPDGHWSNIEYLPCTAENGFVPALPTGDPDLIYLCYPNNPTGTSLTRTQLKEWVDYARSHGAIILFDSAYEAYICQQDVPHSIYEIEGAKECAIEFRSFSKTAGFTGLRLGYTIVPKALKGAAPDGTPVDINRLWLRRQTTKFNGASYVVQRGAEGLYTTEGRRQIEKTVAYYMRNADLLRRGLTEAGLEVYGGINAPYIWIKTPGGMSSWEFFDKLLHECNVVGTPGVGFGPSGEGYFRLTAFGRYEDTLEAVDRLKRLDLTSSATAN